MADARRNVRRVTGPRFTWRLPYSSRWTRAPARCVAILQVVLFRGLPEGAVQVCLPRSCKNVRELAAPLAAMSDCRERSSSPTIVLLLCAARGLFLKFPSVRRLWRLLEKFLFPLSLAQQPREYFEEISRDLPGSGVSIQYSKTCAQAPQPGKSRGIKNGISSVSYQEEKKGTEEGSAGRLLGWERTYNPTPKDVGATR